MPQTADPADSPSESVPASKKQVCLDKDEYIQKLIGQLKMRIKNHTNKNNRPDTCSISKA